MNEKEQIKRNFRTSVMDECASFAVDQAVPITRGFHVPLHVFRRA